MGRDYTFIGYIYHLMAENRDLCIDLLLFHRRLIAIELKIGEFEKIRRETTTVSDNIR